MDIFSKKVLQLSVNRAEPVLVVSEASVKSTHITLMVLCARAAFFWNNDFTVSRDVLQVTTAYNWLQMEKCQVIEKLVRDITLYVGSRVGELVFQDSVVHMCRVTSLYRVRVCWTLVRIFRFALIMISTTLMIVGFTTTEILGDLLQWLKQRQPGHTVMFINISFVGLLLTQ